MGFGSQNRLKRASLLLGNGFNKILHGFIEKHSLIKHNLDYDKKEESPYYGNMSEFIKKFPNGISDWLKYRKNSKNRISKLENIMAGDLNSKAKSIVDNIDKLELSSEELEKLFSIIKNKLFEKPDDLKEKLSELEHEQWVHWTKYMLENYDKENIKRWKRQIDTPYKDLSEKEKDGDREWAQKVLDICETHKGKDGKVKFAYTHIKDFINNLNEQNAEDAIKDFVNYWKLLYKTKARKKKASFILGT